MVTLAAASELRRSEGRLRLSVEWDEELGFAILHCAGRICFRKEVELLGSSAVEQLSCGRHLLLVFTDVEAVDGAGIGQLVLIQMQARASDRKVCVVDAPVHVRQLLSLTNVASLFEFFDSIGEAVHCCSEELA